MSPVEQNNAAPSVATTWLERLEAASVAGNVEAFVCLWVTDDLLCFSWDLRCLNGREKITSYLVEPSGENETTRLSLACLYDFRVASASTLGPPLFSINPYNPAARGVQGNFEFVLASPPGKGRGFLRLIEESPSEWKATTVLMCMDDITGHEESRTRPLGFYPDLSTWDEVLARRAAAISHDPTVLIAGDGLTGLTLAARLGRMGIGALVVEKDEHIGDVWRKRKTFPKFISKNKLADFLEAYATGEDLVIWTSSKLLPTPKYDEVTKRWTVTIDRKGEETIVRPKHIILATGIGKPHHRDASRFKGKRAVVIGAVRSVQGLCVMGTVTRLRIICIDFVHNGAESVTMIQRSATCVTAGSTTDKLVYSVTYNEKFDIEDADFANQSMPLRFALKLAAAGGTARQKAIDKELFEGLEKAGFRLTWQLEEGGPEVGVLGFVAERLAGGSLMDWGCGQLIIDGKVKVNHGNVNGLDEQNALFLDGSSIPADPAIANVIDLFGPSIMSKIGHEVWGLDDEGEFRACYRPSGQPGLWIAMGTFQHCRFLGKRLIQSEELGLK
ncbi:nucleotide-binding domain-containing protein [Laetiporus sulphureus 93-53]|uniref:Nucleotide-binding domain-containing protein n=1 Tax=Laetiporus sulphureus 93-53 TaxID=1314785 RepID=A0A165E581_9APHY|nr:nucleotide-binding domain-containing protein [Laetiporus sulphureus 93-53]KZT06259.1 nucleotide-binding domain-containing protein [Laetiporus sulphureus 93-53]